MIAAMSVKATDLGAEAAEIIKSIDLQASELNRTALDAAREGEEARQNARRAAALVRKYSKQQPRRTSGSHITTKSSFMEISDRETTSPPPPRLTTQAKLLNLSLELERCQRALAEEKAQHAATQDALTQAQAAATQCQAEVEQVLHAQETLRQDLGRQLDEVKLELQTSQQRLQAADQDAALALELAQNNAHAREEMEAWYQECLDRNHELEMALERYHSSAEEGGEEQQQHEHAGRLDEAEGSTNDGILPPDEKKNTDEDDDDDDDMVYTKPAVKSAATRTMVANGRLLLEEFRTVTNTSSGSTGRQVVTSPTKAVARAQERRRHLAETLKPLDVPVHPLSDAGLYGRIVTLLRESGRRLSFPGHWWNPPPTESKAVTGEEAEILTKRYCQAVEREMERKQKEVFELESLCALMETKDKS